ncbi:MAG TPA: Kae1-associated kinase Bud32 [Candidatus Bathyarchaeia archaeon]|nr:Kae1-associated kinase Bud32 [Candidatus Bathyarchaeia archaeon]
MDTANLRSTLLHRGAEADLSLATVGPWRVVVKRRVNKEYRNPSLDEQIRHDRTISEASAIHEAKTAGARVPSIVGIDIENNAIVMTHLAGTVARECLDDLGIKEARKLLQSVGAQIGLLHTSGIVHGDLTTSNIIVSPSGAPFTVDFGMSRRSVEPEDRGVDLHLLHRSIVASHSHDPSSMMNAMIRGYEETAGKKVASSTWRKAREIARRGRYFAIR